MSLIFAQMAFQFPAPLVLLCLSLVAVAAISRRALEVGVYWGQNGNEGSLLEACNAGNYQIVNIAFNISTGSGRTPEINLSGQCDPINGGCARFSEEIRACQALGINVLLSIGGEDYNFNSTDEATNLAMYLWNNFLGGQSSSRPLGDAVLDGVDITEESGNWDDSNSLAKELGKLRDQQQGKKKFYFSAAPQCSSVDDASPHSVPEPGIFDYVWVKFYGNNPSCQYSNGRLEGFWASWNMWKTFSAGQVFVGLLARPVAEGMGYISPDVFRTEVLPELDRSSKFGGVMLWSKALDRGYSSAINPKVCGSVDTPSASDMAMFPMGDKYGGARGFRSCRGTCVVL